MSRPTRQQQWQRRSTDDAVELDVDDAAGADNIIIINKDETVVNEEEDAVEYQLDEGTRHWREKALKGAVFVIFC